MTITYDLDDIPLYTLGGGTGRSHSNAITKGPGIDEDRYDQLGTHCSEYEWRVGTVYPIRDDDGNIYEAVYTVEGDWTDDAVEDTLPEVMADIPYLDDELPVTVYNSDTPNEYTVTYEEMEQVRQDWLDDANYYDMDADIELRDAEYNTAVSLLDDLEDKYENVVHTQFLHAGGLAVIKFEPDNWYVGSHLIDAMRDHEYRPTMIREWSDVVSAEFAKF